MASGIITTVRLEPFYQHFLRSHFEQTEDELLTFPKGHDLQTRINLLLSKAPPLFREHDYGDFAFDVELYYLGDKDVRQRNYISEKRSKIFAQKVSDFYKMLFHEFYSKRYRFFKHKEIVYMWMEKYDMEESAYDRIERDARRYRRKNTNKKYYEKRKLTSVKNSPVQSDFCPA